MSGDWIHTIRGQRLVEGTLPRIARAVEKLNELLQADVEEWEGCKARESPGPGWEPRQALADDYWVWRRRIKKEKK